MYLVTSGLRASRLLGSLRPLASWLTGLSKDSRSILEIFLEPRFLKSVAADFVAVGFHERLFDERISIQLLES